MNFQGGGLTATLPQIRGRERQILEIKIESRVSGRPMIMNSSTVAEICEKINMEIPRTVYGYQIHYAYRSSIVNLLVKDGVPYEQYIRREPFNLNSDLEITSIKPAGNQEVTLVVLGLDFMVDDSVIFNYVEKFGGKMVSQNVIYGRDRQGPFKGLLNGERKYLVDMSDAVCSMGTYHFIGKSKVKILYKGNSKTCGKCHSDSERCPGRGIASDCSNNRFPLEEYMNRLMLQV